MSWRGDPGETPPDEDPTERFPVRHDTYEAPSGTYHAPSAADEPRRFTPLLAAAAAVAVVAVLVLLVVVLSAGDAPPGSPVAPLGASGEEPAGSLGTALRDARPSDGDEAQGFAPPPFSDIVCTEPVDGFAARPVLIQAFRQECVAALDAVLTAESIDPAQVIEAAWAYRVQEIGAPDAGAPAAEAPAAGPLGEIYLVLEGERRVRFYLVSFDPETGAAVLAGRFTRVREIGPTVVFRWSRDAV